MTVTPARPPATEPSIGVDLLEPASTSSPDQPGRANRHRWASALISYLVMVYVLITLNFLLPRLMPGDPITGLLGQGSANFTFGEQTRTALRKYYGLNGSLLSQYFHYLSRLVHGDLGRSVVTNASVWREISRPIPWTLLLIGSSVFVSAIIGVVAGVHAGWRRDRPMDRALTVGLVTIWQIPAYLLGPIVLYVFAVKLHWLPLFGAQTEFSGTFGLVHKALDIGQHLLMPLVVLTAGLVAWNYLLMRAGMVSELGSDYLMLGRAKGLRPRRLKYRYAARNALLPVVANTALDIGFAVTANIVIEQVFSYPGLGRLLFSSIGTRDYPVIQGVFLLLSLGIVTVNALADVFYGRLDPRTVR